MGRSLRCNRPHRPGRPALVRALALAVAFVAGLGCETRRAEPGAGASPTAPPPRAEPVRIRVGVAIPSYVHAVAWIGQRAGHFERAGVRAEVTVMGGSAATMRALIGDSIDVGLAGGDAALKAHRAGADLVIIASVVDRFYHRLIVRQDIADRDGLRGQKIGLPFLGGPQDMAVKVALDSLGLSYDDDVQILGLGKEFNRMAALTRGAIAATTSQTPASRLAELGARVLVDLPATGGSFPYIVAVTRRSHLDRHPERVRGFLTGLCRAIAYYRDPDNQTRSLAIIAEALVSSDASGAARERYASAGPGFLEYPPRVRPATFERLLDLMAIRDVAQRKELLDGLFAPALLEQIIASGGCPVSSAGAPR